MDTAATNFPSPACVFPRISG